MKTYKAPEILVIDMETSVVMEGSAGPMSINSGSTTRIQLSGRNRGSDWSDYEE
jgi:hypothetical protein